MNEGLMTLMTEVPFPSPSTPAHLSQHTSGLWHPLLRTVAPADLPQLARIL